MKPEDKLRRFEVKQAAQAETARAAKEVALAIIGNPLIDLVAGALIMEYAERKGWTGPIITTTTEVGLIGVTTAQALAPIAPQLIEAGADIGKVLSMVKG